MTNKSIPRAKAVDQTVLIDNVLRSPSSGLDVIIVGAGPGGLLAALECWRKGHNVQVFEKSPGISSIGDIIALGPSALATIRHYPAMLQEYVDVAIDAQAAPCLSNGQHALEPFEFEWNRPDVAKHAAYPVRIAAIIGRFDLANLFYKQCQRLGINITWNTSVGSYKEDLAAGCGIAITDEGTELRGDIVVAADGIGSKSHQLTLGRSVRAISTGYTIFRAAMSTNELGDAPLLREIIQQAGRPQTRIYSGHHQHIVFVVSPTLISFAFTLPDGRRGTSQESWADTVTAEEMLAQVPDASSLDPLVIETIQNFPKGRIVAWKLCMRDPQPTWTSEGGYVVQLGDSAHSFIPTSGNGATMALEDAISFAECLRLAGRENRSVAGKVHQMIRHDRVSLVQRTGLRNRVAMHQASSDNIKSLAKTMLQGKWIWAHKAEQYATENFGPALESLKNGSKYDNTNLPPGHKPESWTLQGEVEKEEQGLITDLTTNGDWSLI